MLEGNKGAVSALAFSPDGTHLAAGDVRSLFLLTRTLLTVMQSSGRIVLFNVQEKKVLFLLS